MLSSPGNPRIKPTTGQLPSLMTPLRRDALETPWLLPVHAQVYCRWSVPTSVILTQGFQSQFSHYFLKNRMWHNMWSLNQQHRQLDMRVLRLLQNQEQGHEVRGLRSHAASGGFLLVLESENRCCRAWHLG